MVCITEMLEELRREREYVEEAIPSLERLPRTEASVLAGHQPG